MNRQDAKNAKVEPDSRVDGLARSVIGAAIEVYLERQKPVSVIYKRHYWE